jgi:hypothetical protein
MAGVFSSHYEYGTLKPVEVILRSGRAPVTHACNPSYAGGRDQEDGGSKPARANSSQTLPQKTQHREGLVAWLKV